MKAEAVIKRVREEFSRERAASRNWEAYPKRRRIGSLDGRSGVMVTYDPTRRVIEIEGWYDHFVGIEPVEIPLEVFVSALRLPVELKRRKGAVHGS